MPAYVHSKVMNQYEMLYLMTDKQFSYAAYSIANDVANTKVSVLGRIPKRLFYDMFRQIHIELAMRSAYNGINSNIGRTWYSRHIDRRVSNFIKFMSHTKYCDKWLKAARLFTCADYFEFIDFLLYTTNDEHKFNFERLGFNLDNIGFDIKIPFKTRWDRDIDELYASVVAAAVNKSRILNGKSSIKIELSDVIAEMQFVILSSISRILR